MADTLRYRKGAAPPADLDSRSHHQARGGGSGKEHAHRAAREPLPHQTALPPAAHAETPRRAVAAGRVGGAAAPSSVPLIRYEAYPKPLLPFERDDAWWAFLVRYKNVQMTLCALAFWASCLVFHAWLTKISWHRGVVLFNMVGTPPLHDLLHEVLPNMQRLRVVPEIGHVLPVLYLSGLMLYHFDQRSIDCFRSFLLSHGVLMLLRAASFVGTLLPDSSEQCHVSLFVGSCHDLIFSGHVVIMLNSVLLAQHFFFIPPVLRVLVGLDAVVVSVLVIATRNHYTVDVVLAVVATLLVYLAFTRHPFLVSLCVETPVNVLGMPTHFEPGQRGGVCGCHTGYDEAGDPLPLRTTREGYEVMTDAEAFRRMTEHAHGSLRLMGLRPHAVIRAVDERGVPLPCVAAAAVSGHTHTHTRAGRVHCGVGGAEAPPPAAAAPQASKGKVAAKGAAAPLRQLQKQQQQGAWAGGWTADGCATPPPAAATVPAISAAAAESPPPSPGLPLDDEQLAMDEAPLPAALGLRLQRYAAAPASKHGSGSGRRNTLPSPPGAASRPPPPPQQPAAAAALARASLGSSRPLASPPPAPSPASLAAAAAAGPSPASAPLRLSTTPGRSGAAAAAAVGRGGEAGTGGSCASSASGSEGIGSSWRGQPQQQQHGAQRAAAGGRPRQQQQHHPPRQQQRSPANSSGGPGGSQRLRHPAPAAGLRGSALSVATAMSSMRERGESLLASDESEEGEEGEEGEEHARRGSSEDLLSSSTEDAGAAAAAAAAASLPGATRTPRLPPVEPSWFLPAARQQQPQPGGSAGNLLQLQPPPHHQRSSARSSWGSGASASRRGRARSNMDATEYSALLLLQQAAAGAAGAAGAEADALYAVADASRTASQESWPPAGDEEEQTEAALATRPLAARRPAARSRVHIDVTGDADEGGGEPAAADEQDVEAADEAEDDGAEAAGDADDSALLDGPELTREDQQGLEQALARIIVARHRHHTPNAQHMAREISAAYARVQSSARRFLRPVRHLVTDWVRGAVGATPASSSSAAAATASADASPAAAAAAAAADDEEETAAPPELLHAAAAPAGSASAARGGSLDAPADAEAAVGGSGGVLGGL